MSRKKRELSSDEKHLWRRVAATVKPRRPQPKADDDEAPVALAPKRVIAATVPKRVAPPRAPPKPEPPLANRGGEKRVRRGKLEIDGSFDLHGHTQHTGFAALARFLHTAARRDARVVLVVTGVGRTGEGVLRKRLPEWLGGRELKPLISGYAQAHRAHGGSGAFYVFLRRARE